MVLLTVAFTVPLVAWDTACVVCKAEEEAAAAFTAAFVEDCRPRFNCPKAVPVMRVATDKAMNLLIVFIDDCFDE
jgi:hypothetical protein